MSQFNVSMIGDWSEDRSEEFWMLQDIWFGRVVIKNLRMSCCLFKCDGQYVKIWGAIIFKVLFVIKLFNAQPWY